MKKSLLTLIFLAIVATIAAQDIIFKRDGTQIEATITERNENDLRYRRANYPDGPLFLVNLVDLDSIIYANGDIEIFVLESEIQPALVKDTKGHYFYNGTKISNKDMVKLLSTKCPDAYLQYKNNLRDEIWGACLTGVGLIMLGVGIGVPEYYRYNGFNYHPTGYGVMTTFGCIFTLIGVPLWTVGSINRQNSYNLYNEYCKSQEIVNFTIQRSGNGIGLALNF